MDNNDVTYFDSFGVEHISKEIKKFIGSKNITANIFRIRAYHSLLCGHFCIRFIDSMHKDKSLWDYINSFFPNEYKRNERIILKYFQ